MNDDSDPQEKLACYKLTIAYDGTGYGGWQIQPNAVTIQQCLQEALSRLMKGEAISLVGAGRTDAGVHAEGQVAHFKTGQSVDVSRLCYSLNALLPKDIRVKDVELALPSFHAQKSAYAKAYHYHIHLSPVIDPFCRLYSWHLFHKIDIEKMKEGAKLFVGTRDFTSFANEATSGAAAKNPVRTIHSLDIVPRSGGVTLRFYGNGFLYKMVRNIVGTLVDVAAGRLSVDDVCQIFAAKDRRLAGTAAPPHGLFLVRVDY